MKKHLVSLFVSLAVVATGVLTFIPVQSAFAQVKVFDAACQGGGNSGSGQAICGANQGKGLPELVKIIINTMIFIVGTIAVVMIVIGGVKYVTSNGEAAQLQSAKNTVLYSVIGLIVAISAFAIVNFVLDQFK